MHFRTWLHPNVCALYSVNQSAGSGDDWEVPKWAAGSNHSTEVDLWPLKTSMSVKIGCFQSLTSVDSAFSQRTREDRICVTDFASDDKNLQIQLLH